MTHMSKKKPVKTQVGEVRAPTQFEIAVRAYEIFLERGRQDGRSIEDWLQAERELSGGLKQPRTARSLPLGLRLLE